MTDIPIFGPPELHDDIKIWCDKQFGYEGWISGYWGWSKEHYYASGPFRGKKYALYEFVREADATMFLLRWM